MGSCGDREREGVCHASGVESVGDMMLMLQLVCLS